MTKKIPSSRPRASWLGAMCRRGGKGPHVLDENKRQAMRMAKEVEDALAENGGSGETEGTFDATEEDMRRIVDEMIEQMPGNAAGVMNVMPINDLREHDEDETCWCRPRVEVEGRVSIVIHNAMDEREKFETGERKPS